MLTLLGLHFVPFPGPSSSGDQVFGERGRLTYRLLRPCCLVFWVYSWHTLDINCTESREVLVSNKAYLQFGR